MLDRLREGRNVRSNRTLLSDTGEMEKGGGGVVWSAAGGANTLQRYHGQTVSSGFKMMSLFRE